MLVRDFTVYNSLSFDHSTIGEVSPSIWIPTLEKPTPNARGAVRDTYLKWLHDRIMIRCIMRASMNDKFSQKFEEAQPEKMLQVLTDSFGTPDDVERHKTNCTIFNTE